MAPVSDAHHERLAGGALQNAICQAVVQLLADRTGRGPTHARTTIDGDLIGVLLADASTPGERYLVDSGRGEQVEDMRQAYQEAMRTDWVTAIETGAPQG